MDIEGEEANLIRIKLCQLTILCGIPLVSTHYESTSILSRVVKWSIHSETDETSSIYVWSGEIPIIWSRRLAFRRTVCQIIDLTRPTHYF